MVRVGGALPEEPALPLAVLEAQGDAEVDWVAQALLVAEKEGVRVLWRAGLAEEARDSVGSAGERVAL